MKGKRKRCSDQCKAGELNFSYQRLVTIPPDFLIFVSRTMVFLEYFNEFYAWEPKVHRTGGNQNQKKAERWTDY